MTPFLKQVADHYYKAGDMQRRCFIFPNRRSMVFFSRYLSEAVSDRPIVAPRMLTINDFFFSISGAQPSDRVGLLLDLYECYRALNPKAESLDEFIFWGDVILGDFNDIDKYLVDPAQLFANVSDFKRIQDSFCYLTPTQRKAVEGFISHFKGLSPDMEPAPSDMKERFLQIWNILYPLYTDFNARLRSKGVAYEGMVYRNMANALKERPVEDVFKETFPDAGFVFVGLNALNECEKVLLRKLRDASRAEFCWDYCTDMIRDPQNRSSLFMRDNVTEFPQASTWDSGTLKPPQVNVMSVSSSVGQAKRLPDILRSMESYDEDCAVVLPDEGLLIPVLNSIPPEVSDINVTMGLPMQGSLLYSLMSDIASIQLHAVDRGGTVFFYHKQVWDLFSNDLFRKASDESVMEKVKAVRKGAKYYIPQEELSGTPLLDVIFRRVLTDSKSADADQISALADYQKAVIQTLASAVSSDASMALEMEYAKAYYQNINLLQEISLAVQPLTYIRLLGQLLSSVSVPFRGEPLKGLQIMGPLETRALDFRNIIILSANEGVFPRRNVSSSFIPPELRKGFGLPTYEYQDAVWAYYFYRMISRAENVWMLVDSRTEGLKSGEESRYIKQLEYHFTLPLKRYCAALPPMAAASSADLVKTEEDVQVIRNTALSATTVQNYLACPARFYYATVKGLQAEETVTESLDYGMFGTVYHDTMRALYTSEKAMMEDDLSDAMKRVDRAYIRMWLGRKDDIRNKVRSLIVNQLNTMQLSGRNLVVTDVIVRYVMKTLQRDLEILEKNGAEAFEVLGRETRVEGVFHGQRFKGYIDRLDSLSPDSVRVVDYKTGKVLPEDEDIRSDNAEDIAEKIFAPDVKERPKIALQFFIYDMLLDAAGTVPGRKVYNCVYSTARLFREPPVTVARNEVFFNAVSERLKALLDEMYDVNVPFRRTGDLKVCSFCDFKTICGR